MICTSVQLCPKFSGGTTPANAKEAQGDIWVDPHVKVDAAKVDTVKVEVEVDSLAYKKTVMKII